MSTEKKKNGRPPIYDNPTTLQRRIDAYFKRGITKRTVTIGPANNKTTIQIPVPTITGLVLYCGFCDRRSFYAYEKKPEFGYTIKAARTRIEREYEEALQGGLGSGAIFALKNFGWVDKQEIEHSGNVKLTKEVIDARVARTRKALAI